MSGQSILSYFTLILFVLTIVTGIIWFLDVFFLAKQRKAKAAAALAEFDARSAKLKAEGIKFDEGGRAALEANILRQPQNIRQHAGRRHRRSHQGVHERGLAGAGGAGQHDDGGRRQLRQARHEVLGELVHEPRPRRPGRLDALQLERERRRLDVAQQVLDRVEERGSGERAVEHGGGLLAPVPGMGRRRGCRL